MNNCTNKCVQGTVHLSSNVQVMKQIMAPCRKDRNCQWKKGSKEREKVWKKELMMKFEDGDEKGKMQLDSNSLDLQTFLFPLSNS